MTQQITRQQRWIQWRNVDVTACPAFGCVELVGFDKVGANVVMHGRSATSYGREPNIRITEVDGELVTAYKNNMQGAQWNHAFNDSCAVQPEDLGYCTFDLPTWAASVHPAAQIQFGLTFTLGQFFLIGNISHVIGPDDNGEYHTLGTDAAFQVGEPWRLGSLNTQFIPGHGESGLYFGGACGWNVYNNDLTAVTGHDRVFIGGLRTWNYHNGPGGF